MPPLFLHPLSALTWQDWSIHWSTVIGLVALGALYVYAWRFERPDRAEKISFFSGLAIIFLSLNGPIHDLSDFYLFSAHMVQHLLLTLVVPPLLLAGVRGGMLRPLLSVRSIGAFARWLTRPITGFVLFNIVLALWHVPAFYNTAMANHNVHIAQHLSMMVTATLMWWPLMSPLPELPRLSYPGQMLYCFLMVIPMSVVAIYIALADSLLYPAYAAAPRIWGISPMLDQHIGGLIMWIPGGLFFYVIMSVVFFKWVNRGEDSTAAAQVDWTPPVREGGDEFESSRAG